MTTALYRYCYSKKHNLGNLANHVSVTYSDIFISLGGSSISGISPNSNIPFEIIIVAIIIIILVAIPVVRLFAISLRSSSSSSKSNNKSHMICNPILFVAVMMATTFSSSEILL